jgi:glucose/arabinose dehydrogenase
VSEVTVRRSASPWIAVLAAALWAQPQAANGQLAAQTIVSGIAGIVAFVQDPVEADTFYLPQRSGRIDVWRNGAVLPTPFLDLTGQVGGGGEQGLLGMAFAPDAAISRRVFVNYTDLTGATVVARFTSSATNLFVADPATRFDLQWPDGTRALTRPGSSHNGGHLAFGPDGYLYIGLGDGGIGLDPLNHAQRPDSLLGKMLRIDVNVPDTDQKGYRIPPDNPFVGLPALAEIWDFGFRNPWRYSFDNKSLGGTGALIIGDVGEKVREEVNYEPAGRGGRNYGWRIREGSIPTPGVEPAVPLLLPLREPLFDYPHQPPKAAAVTGGFVYRGSRLPAQFRGRYFVADFISGIVASVGLSVNPTTGEATITNVTEHTIELGGAALGRIVSFAEDRAGELYIIRHNAPGAVYQIVPTADAPGPPINFTPQVAGTTVSLSWLPGPGGAPSAYRLEVGSVSGASNVLVLDLPDTPTGLTAPGITPGTYFARLRGVNSFGVSSPSAEIRVEVGCGAPAPPTGLANAVANGIGAFVWNAVPGATGYRLEIGLATGRADVAVMSLPAAPAGLIMPASTGTFFARLRAENACGVSAPSNEVVVAVP